MRNNLYVPLVLPKRLAIDQDVHTASLFENRAFEHF